MTGQIKVVRGKNRKEAMEKLNESFKKYQIINEKAFKKWFFIVADYEIKVMVEVEEPKKNEPQKAKEENEEEIQEKLRNKREQSKPRKLNKDMSPKEKDQKKAELLKMLNEPQNLNEMVKNVEQQDEEVNNTLSELKSMIETLVEELKEEKQGKKPLPLPLEKMENYLKEQEVDERTARIYVEKAEKQFEDLAIIEDEHVSDAIQKMIENQINVFGPINSDNKIISVVGPTGVGKTTTLAKIAWELHKNDRTVGFITTDTFRSGAKQQLEAFGEAIDCETVVAESVEELKEAIEYYETVNKVDHILIDTVGRNPMLEESISSVKEYLDVSNPSVTALVLSATSKVKDIKEILSRFESASVNAMIFTKLDETYNVGSLLNVFNFTKLPLLFVTDGQAVTKNIYAPTKKTLAKKIMEKEVELQGKILA